MENDELKSLIKQSVREALHELLSWSEGDRRYKDYPHPYFLYRFERYLHRETEELGSQVGRLSMLVSKFESWSSSGCKYDSSEISEVKRLLASIDGKLP